MCFESIPSGLASLFSDSFSFFFLAGLASVSSSSSNIWSCGKRAAK